MDENQPDTFILSDVPAEEDALDFGPYIRTLAKIIQSPNTDTPLTIGVFGTWGSGKTSLMRMVCKELPNTFHTVWFDAWKYDKEDALWRALILQVLAEVRALAQSQKPVNKEEDKAKGESLDALDDLEGSLYRSVERESLGELQVDWRELLKGSVETALHVGIALVPGLRIAQTVLEEAGKKVTGDDPGRLLKAVEREKTKIYSEHVRSLEQFQGKFSCLVKRLIRDRDTKLVVFIDDLDRCTPEKAIAVLEAIKLFLDVKGCVFVLGLDQAVVARGVELKYRELGFHEDGEAKARIVIDGTRYLEKIIQLPFQLPPIETEIMETYVSGLMGEWPDESCAGVFAAGLGENPRQIKRAVNVFLLLWALAQERVKVLQDRIKPVRLAKVVVIQNTYPELYEVLKRTPRMLRDLEAYYRSEAAEAALDIWSAEEEDVEPESTEPPPGLAPYVSRPAVRRTLTMHPADTPDANFTDLPPDELRLYFTLTRRAEAPQVEPLEVSRRFIEPQLVRVPSGSFLMGSTDEQIEAVIHEGLNRDIAMREKPQHRIELEEYQIGKYPVTNLEYQAFVQETGYPPPRDWNGNDYPIERSDHPVVYVSWSDAVAYCDWLARRSGKYYYLPSEAEWEKAARGPDGLIYPWGDEFDPAKGNTKEGDHSGTTPVGQFSPQGDSPYGCADMAGNVWEWTRSLDLAYPYDLKDGRENMDNADDTQRILRGGSFSSLHMLTRCAYRRGDIPDTRLNYRGFRVVVSPSISER